MTITGDALADFGWRGFDHWFRLFLRLPHQDDFQLPDISGTGWWKHYRLIPKARRPHCSNYTVGGFRAAEREMDIDFVVHRNKHGELEG
ncbi:MAG: siderophore-interacting protein, partial [Microbacteriaceae bacterium]